jgi:hypothetical protein
MLAMVISINGEQILVAGEEICELLTAHIFAMRDSDVDKSEYHIEVSGLPEQREKGKHHHLRWKRTPFNVGDEITIKLTDVPTADPPLKRYRSDSEVQESPYTEDEIRERQWQTYLFLKKKFEGSVSEG